MRAFLAGRSITTRPTEALLSFFLRYSRTRISSASMPPNALSSAYQRELQLRFTARRNPIGCTFCPIVTPYAPTLTTMWQVCFSIRLPRPFARAEKRFIDWPLSTWIVVTLSSSISAPSLCSALAIADSRAFLSRPAAFLGVNVRIFSAWATDLPRIISATRRAFWAEIWTPRIIAVVSITYLLDFLSAAWPLNVRVSANSPSLWPTMFSLTYTGTCWRPLCTAIVSPMNSGRMVERRDQVLIGFLSLPSTAASIFLIKCASTNGPFLIERDIVFAPYLRLRRETIILSVRL